MPRKREDGASCDLPLFPHGSAPEPSEGYYSGDQPNPNLRAFVEQHLREHPYDPATDDYDVPAFDQPIQASKVTAIYNMHSYHQGKKPHDAIRQYIHHYTQSGDLVLDPFCGSGSTALAALMEGCKAIAIDRSPAATFITKNYCTPVGSTVVRSASAELDRRVRAEIDWLYETRCDRCGGRAVTQHTVYSQVFQCPRCLEKVALFDCPEVTLLGKRGVKKARVCPHCHARGCEEAISTRSRKYGAVPVLVSYVCLGGCTPRHGERRHNDPDAKKREFFDRYDLGKLREIEKRSIPHWYPDLPMVKGRETCVKRNLAAQGVRCVGDLFSRRNLWALAAIVEIARALGEPEARDVVVFALNGVILGMSRMNQYRPDVSYPTSIMKGTYYIPQIWKEESPLRHVLNKLERLDRGYQAIRSELRSSALLIDTRSATCMEPIAANSVDYIFTDPPYGNRVQYGELNFVWEAWLGLDTRWLDEEIIVNGVRGRTEADWAELMRQAMAECYRVLKPGRWLSLCYHDTSEGTWGLVQDIMTEVGFVVDRTDAALFIDTKQKSYNQLTADKVTKRDLVINFRKPGTLRARPTARIRETDERTFREYALAVIRDYLSAHPGATKDHIYDDLVSRLVRAGRMEPHDFDELLAQVAEAVHEPVRKNLFENEEANLFGTHEVVRWYLKEGDEVALDSAEAAKEDAAAERLGAYIRSQLEAQPELDGVDYSHLFEQYVYTVTDRPRRDLADWLPDYFFVTESGGYRLPADEEEGQLKARARASGTNRRIKRYLAALEEGRPIPPAQQPGDATLADWIRQCKRGGLYEQGKMLYERGGLRLERLPEELQVAVEEDYQTCVRLLARGK